MSVTRINTQNYELSRVQDFLANAIDRLDSEIVNGHQIDSIDLTAGEANTINHGLGRNLRGYIVVRKDANASIWDETSSTPAKTLKLQTSSDCTVSLWVY